MNKKEVINEEDLENYYSKCRKIKFKNDYQPKDIQDLFTKMVDYENSATVYLKGGHQCEPYKARSLNDIIVIAKHYFPNTTVKEILKEIRGMLKNSFYDEKTKMNHNLGLYYCHTIKKNNFHKTLGTYNINSIENSFDDIEFNINGFVNSKLKVRDLL